MVLSNLSSGAGDDAESAAHLVTTEARNGLGVSVEKDDEGQRGPGLSDPRNAEVRPVARAAY